MNVWVATTVATHPHHRPALRWWGEVAGTGATVVLMCRVAQLGVLRLLSNAYVMGSARHTPAEAWSAYERLIASPHVGFVAEPQGTEQELRRLTAGLGPSARIWTDAYLAAFAIAGGLRLATFDRGFRRFRSLDLELLG